MTDDSFTTTITVDAPPGSVFDAITQPRTWWSPSITGDADREGGELVFDSPGHHLWKFRVVELERPQWTVWEVLDDSTTDFVDDRAEWNGSQVRFELRPIGDRTEVRFTHLGLGSELECYEACSAGWAGYIQHSLRDLIATGRGRPGEF